MKFFPGIKCPVCSKFVLPDEIECHLIMCLTKPRISYNGRLSESRTYKPGHGQFFFCKLSLYFDYGTSDLVKIKCGNGGGFDWAIFDITDLEFM